MKDKRNDQYEQGIDRQQSTDKIEMSYGCLAADPFALDVAHMKII